MDSCWVALGLPGTSTKTCGGLREQEQYQSPRREPACCHCWVHILPGVPHAPHARPWTELLPLQTDEAPRAAVTPAEMDSLQSPFVSRHGLSQTPSDWLSLDHVSEPLTAEEAENVSAWLPWGRWSLSPIKSHEGGESPDRKSDRMLGEGVKEVQRE